MQERRLDVDVDQDLLESFAESLSSMDYTTLCIMNHKSREEHDKNIPMLHNYDMSFPDDRNLLFHGNSLDNIERMHWHYIDGSNESLRNLYDANIPPSQLMPPIPQNKVSTKNTVKQTSGRLPSAAAKQRRRERNKVLARRTRVKKKVEMETLRDDVIALMKENEKMRSFLAANLKDDNIIKSLESTHDLPENIVSLIEQMKSNEERNLCIEMKAKQSSFCIVSTTQIDNPIVFASTGFYELTGYTKEQIIGRNCRFLQGPNTDKNEVKKIKDSLSRKEDFSSILLNYHRDGTTFLNRIEIAHLKDNNGNTPFIVGLQSKITEKQQQYFNELANTNENASSNSNITNILNNIVTTSETKAVLNSSSRSSSENGSKNKKNIKTKIKIVKVHTSKSSGSSSNSLNGTSNNTNGASTTTTSTSKQKNMKKNQNPSYRRISGTTSPTDSSGTVNSNNQQAIPQQQQQLQSQTQTIQKNNNNNKVKEAIKNAIHNNNNMNKSSNNSCSNSTTNTKSTSNESNSAIHSNSDGSRDGTNSHSDEGEGIDKSGSGSGEDNNATGYGSNSEPSMENPFEI